MINLTNITGFSPSFVFQKSSFHPPEHEDSTLYIHDIDTGNVLNTFFQSQTILNGDGAILPDIQPAQIDTELDTVLQSKTFCLFELMLNAPVNSNDHVGTLSPFYGTLTQHQDTQNVLYKYNHTSKPIGLTCMDGLTKPLSLGMLTVIRWSVSILEASPEGTRSPSISLRPEWIGVHIPIRPPLQQEVQLIVEFLPLGKSTGETVACESYLLSYHEGKADLQVAAINQYFQPVIPTPQIITMQ